MIPKIVFQTSKEKLPEYTTQNLKMCLGEGWTYYHFTDADIIDFFNSNPLEKFPDIIEVFNSIPMGEHKADLFRYYFLYFKGGIFIDSDFELRYGLNDIIEKYNFFSCESGCEVDCYFNGFLGAEPGNIIIYDALEHAYNIFKNKINIIYEGLCEELKHISKNYNHLYNIKIFNEAIVHHQNKQDYAILYDKNLNYEIIGIHFQSNGYVPKNSFDLSLVGVSKFKSIVDIYRKILRREPDANGLQHYLTWNYSLTQIESILLESQEYKELYKK